MKPDEIITVLKDRWGLETTRRTLLSYENNALIPPPYFETGKAKEYPDHAVAEFIASWCLTHGEYGIKSKKVAEIREKALKIMYYFPDEWEEEGISDQSIYDFALKQVCWKRASDLFIFSWAMIRQIVNDCPLTTEDEEKIKKLISTGQFKHIPEAEIIAKFTVAKNGQWNREFITTTLVDGVDAYERKLVVEIRGANLIYDYATISYLHPGDFVAVSPRI